jgi:hypothetical protein
MSLFRSIDQEVRSRRLRKPANSVGDEDHIRSEFPGQAKREYLSIKRDLTQEFVKFMNISEECELNCDMLVALGCKDMAEERDAALKSFGIL